VSVTSVSTSRAGRGNPGRAPAVSRGKTRSRRGAYGAALVGVCRSPVSRLFTFEGLPIPVRVLVANADRNASRAFSGVARETREPEVALPRVSAARPAAGSVRPATAKPAEAPAGDGRRRRPVPAAADVEHGERKAQPEIGETIRRGESGLRDPWRC